LSARAGVTPATGENGLFLHVSKEKKTQQRDARMEKAETLVQIRWRFKKANTFNYF
jgi:hypothetical protein